MGAQGRRWQRPKGAAFLNIAHRGARAFAPENTLAAFAKAVAMGCDMVELDVRLSGDGVPVVFHDENLLSRTDAALRFPGRASYAVADFTWEELQILDAGGWYARQVRHVPAEREPWLQSLTDREWDEFVSAAEWGVYASGEIRIPSLDEVLAFAQDAKLALNIELKPARVDTGLAEAAVGLIEQAGMAERVLLSSFDHRQLEQVRRCSGHIPFGVLAEEPLANPVDYLRGLDAHVYLPGCYSHGGRNELSLAEISAACSDGLDAVVWTCNDREHIRQLIDAGVTGIISDFPNRVRETLASIEPQASAETGKAY